MQQDKKLKIVQVYASRGWGGGERYVLDISRSLVASGHEVISISKKCSTLSSKIAPTDSYYQLSMNGFLDFCSGIKLAKIIKRENPDIIHVHNFKDAFVAVYAKKISGKDVKIVVSRHLVKRSKKNFLYNWLYKNIDRFIFVSEIAKKEFLSSNICIDEDKIVVIYNSVKSGVVDTTFNIRDKYNIQPTSTIIAFSGRVVSEKGLDVLFEALSLLRDFDFRLIVFGRGEKRYLDELRRKAQELMIADKVIMVGFVDDVRSLISQADIGVIPSIVRESFGLSVIEFMSLGKAVITTNNGAQVEFVDDGVNGFLVPPSDAKAIANRLRELFDNESLRSNIGRQASEYFVNNLSYDKFFENICRLYQGCKD